MKCSSGNLEYVRKEGKGSKVQDQLAWEKLYDQYLGEFGLSERYKKYLLLKQKKALLQAEYVITKEKFKLTEIEMQSTKIANLETYFGDGQKIEVILMWLSKFMGYKIDPKETSVKEYFYLLEEYGKANKTE